MHIHPVTPWQARGLCGLWLSAWLLLSLWPSLSPAQVSSHITSDGTTGTTVTQNGSVYDIDGGTIRGQNQFHSFDQFRVGTGDTASFNGPAGIENIISRVTGGSRSDIDGTLLSTIDGANLFLLNPSGIMFGPNATLNVTGSFHASTANELRFADGASFKVDLSGESRLTMAAPVAFGFLSENPASIVVAGSELEVGMGETLSLVGGNLDIVGGNLVASSGRVNLVSVASSGEVALPLAGEGTALGIGSFARLGDITLTDDAVVDVSGNAGGSLVIRSGELVVDNSLIDASTGDVDGAEVGIDSR
ncbi:hypothetical protein C2W62_16550 [Candidatus Entotheonella serta]|nr:hypothetical protein C2W62_16550 [Candidatus Entotheonella serta]